MVVGKVIVVGGSVGGLFAGLLLQRAGWDVTLYERSASGLAGKGAGLVPQQEVGSILEEIGRLDVLRSGVVARERIFLDRNGNVLQTVQTPQSQISWDLLFEAFRSQFSDTQYKQGYRVLEVSADESSATVRFEDGTSDSADLVVGADGIGSVIRQAVDPGSAPRYAGYAAFRGLAPESSIPAPSSDVLFNRFTFYNAHRTQVLGYLVAGADGSIDPGHRRYNWVWYRPLTLEQLHYALTSDLGGAPRLLSASGRPLSRNTSRTC